MWRNQLDAVALKQVAIQLNTVVGFVADQPCRQLVEEALAQDLFYQLLSCGEALCTLTARGRLWPSATATILVPLPRLVGPTAKPPFSRR